MLCSLTLLLVGADLVLAGASRSLTGQVTTAQFSSLSTRVATLQSQLTQQSECLAQQQQLIGSLQQDNVNLRSSQTQLTSNLAALQASVQTLNGSLAALPAAGTENVTLLSEQVRALQMSVTSLEASLQTPGGGSSVTSLVTSTTCCEALAELNLTVQNLDGNLTSLSEQFGVVEVSLFNLDQQVIIVSGRLEDLDRFNAQFIADIDSLREGRGSTYVQWGSQQCARGANNVYVGFAAGKDNSVFNGGGTNILCLPPNPVFDATVTAANAMSQVFGAEYRIVGKVNFNVPCSVCQTVVNKILMIPATNVCPQDWFTFYAGRLAASRSSDQPTEYICLDQALQDNGVTPQAAGLKLNYVRTACENLDCALYPSGRVVTCVVCGR